MDALWISIAETTTWGTSMTITSAIHNRPYMIVSISGASELDELPGDISIWRSRNVVLRPCAAILPTSSRLTGRLLRVLQSCPAIVDRKSPDSPAPERALASM